MDFTLGPWEEGEDHGKAAPFPSHPAPRKHLTQTEFQQSSKGANFHSSEHRIQGPDLWTRSWLGQRDGEAKAEEPALGVPTVPQGHRQVNSHVQWPLADKAVHPPVVACTPLLMLSLPPGMPSSHPASIYGAPIVYQPLGEQGQSQADLVPAFTEPWMPGNLFNPQSPTPALSLPCAASLTPPCSEVLPFQCSPGILGLSL